MVGGVVAHQGAEHAQLQPAEHQILGGVAAEAAQVGAAVEEAAHVQGRQHLQIQLDVAPPGGIVALPHAAIAVSAHKAGAAEQQEALAAVIPAEALGSGAGHVSAVEVVDLVVADGLAVHFVVEAAVVLHVVGRAVEGVLQGKGAVDVQVLIAQLVRHGKGLGNALLGVEQRRLVHVVPEALDALVHQLAVFAAEPGAHVLPQEIREVAAARPHRTHKGLAVGLLHKVVLLQAHVAGVIALQLLHARIDDGDQPDVIRPHVIVELPQIGEARLVPGEVLEVLHVVDIHAHAVQGDVAVAMLLHHIAHLRIGGIAPAGLDVAKGPLGGQIAAANESAELLADGSEAVSLDDVHAQVAVLGGNDGGIAPGVAQVELHGAGIVKIHAKELLPAAEQQQVVGGVDAGLVLRVGEIVGVPGTVQVAALVDAPQALAQAKHQVVRIHVDGKAHLAVLHLGGKERHSGFFRSKLPHHRAGMDR